MQPPKKDQTDIGVDNPILDCNTDEFPDTTRQEYKDEVDLHSMLHKFGQVPARGAPTYGEWDDSTDLQVAIEAVREARVAYRDLPLALREKFTSMEDMLNALNNGSLVIKEGEEPKLPLDNPPPQQ